MAGCGGGGERGSGAEPSEWAEAVCESIGTWLEDIQARGRELESGVEGVADLERGRDLIAGFLDDVVGLTETMLSDVRGAGVPAVDRGEEIAGDLERGLGQTRSAFSDARERAKELPTDDPASFAREAQELGSSLEEQGDEIKRTLGELDEKYDEPELRKAFREAEACKELRAS